MASSSSSRSNISYHVRSASFPSKSNATFFRVEAELTKIQTREASSTPSAEEICSSLSLLEDLYESLDELLKAPQTRQQELSQNQCEKWVDELLDGSVKILDICGSIRDLVSQIKENVRDHQSALRRRKGDSCTDSSITKYTSFQKKTNKEAKRLISSLKQMKSKTAASAILNVDQQISVVTRVLREVSIVGISILESILVFLCVAVLKQKQSKWSLVSKLINKACENQHENLEGLEGSIEKIENGLEGVFRRMVKTRASLLNTFSS